MKKIIFSLILLVILYFLGDLIYTLLMPLGKLNTHYPHAHIDQKTERITFTLEEKMSTNWVPWSQISPYLRHAIIVAEDSAFYQHNGIDQEQLSDAINQSIKEKRLVRGASTITQQLVKNLYFDHDRSLWRKFKEIILALLIEKQVSKKRILELYLNIIEVKPLSAGVYAGTKYFFKKTPAQLTPREAAFIAMLLPSPKRYAVSFERKKLTAFARGRIRKILLQLAQVGAISIDQARIEFYTPFSWEKY